MPFDAFISYSHKDKLIADSACALVEAVGVRCWIAPRDIRPGAEWSESISDGIDQCRVMILIFSSNSNESRQVRREVAHAFNNGLTIVPVRVEQVEPNRALAFHIETFHWLDALSEPREQYFRELAKHIKAILETQPGPLRERHDDEYRPQDEAARLRHEAETERQVAEQTRQQSEDFGNKESESGERKPPVQPPAKLPESTPSGGKVMPWFEWAARLSAGLIAGFALLVAAVLLVYPLMNEDTRDHFIYLWGGYVGGLSDYPIWFLLKWGGFWGLCFAVLEKYLSHRGTGYWWYVALSGVAVGSMTFVWDVFQFSSAFTGVYFADPASSLTLPIFLWTGLALVLWAFGMAVFLRWSVPRLLRWREATSGLGTA